MDEEENAPTDSVDSSLHESSAGLPFIEIPEDVSISPTASQSLTPTSSSRKPEQESWLLRLFQSEFFDAKLALSYLFKYPKNVGIAHYVCQQLSKYNEHEIEFVLPQIWFAFQFFYS